VVDSNSSVAFGGFLRWFPDAVMRHQAHTGRGWRVI